MKLKFHLLKLKFQQAETKVRKFETKSSTLWNQEFHRLKPTETPYLSTETYLMNNREDKAGNKENSMPAGNIWQKEQQKVVVAGIFGFFKTVLPSPLKHLAH